VQEARSLSRVGEGSRFRKHLRCDQRLPLSVDALPAFDMLPDAMKDVETLVDSSDEDEEALVDSGGEDSSMLLFGVDGCRKGTASTYLAATDIQRPGDGPGVANLCGCAAGAAANVSVWANKITVCG